MNHQLMYITRKKLLSTPRIRKIKISFSSIATDVKQHWNCLLLKMRVFRPHYLVSHGNSPRLCGPFSVCAVCLPGRLQCLTLLGPGQKGVVCVHEGELAMFWRVLTLLSGKRARWDANCTDLLNRLLLKGTVDPQFWFHLFTNNADINWGSGDISQDNEVKFHGCKELHPMEVYYGQVL